MISILKSILIDFVKFLTKPLDKQNTKINFFYFLIAFIIILLFSNFLNICISTFFTILGIPFNEVDKSLVFVTPNGLLFLVGVILAPFIEEFGFRYPLKYTKNSLLISVISITITLFFVNRTVISKQNILQYLIQTFNNPNFLYFILAIIIIYVITRFKRINFYIVRFWGKYINLIIYLYAFYFAFLHFSLPKTAINIVWLLPTVLPQFFMALYFSYIRLRVKFSYCILLHMINNFVVFTFTLYFH